MNIAGERPIVVDSWQPSNAAGGGVEGGARYRGTANRGNVVRPPLIYDAPGGPMRTAKHQVVDFWSHYWFWFLT